MRLAIFGGSFDPPHVGHLLVAEDAYAQLALDRLVFVPGGRQPLKSGGAVATAEQRVDLVRAMVQGDPRFEVSTVETARPGLSFTVDTLRYFATEHPTAERFLLLGADVLESIAQCREPGEVVRLAQPVVLERSGVPANVPATVAGVVLTHMPTRRIDVSSTEIRERIRQGKSIRGFVTEGVAALIRRDRLYR